MVGTKHPIRKLQMRLARSSVANLEDLIDRSERPDEYPLRDDLGLDGAVFVRPSAAVPEWVSFVRTAIDDSLDQLTNRSNGALLLLKVDGRIFAFTFGQGRHLLKENLLEPDFGFLAAINGLEPGSLRSLDTFTLDERSISRRVQASAASEFREFGLEIDHDIMRSATGKPRSATGFESLSGADFALSVGARTDIEGLPDVCRRVLVLSQATTYRSSFEWVDNVRRIRDPVLEAHLWQRAIDKICRAPDHLLMPPDVIDWQKHTGFSLTRRTKKRLLDCVTFKDYVGSFPDIKDLTPERLRSDRLRSFADSDDAAPAEEWSVYRCLQLEVNENDAVYILSGGAWYDVNRSFADKVKRRVSQIKRSPVRLPRVRIADGKVETEPAYNKRAATVASFALLDTKLARCEAAGSGVEVCDLLSPERRLIHVKPRKKGSSSLSHLFAQGRVSAEALVRDEVFRDETRAHLREVGVKWERLVPKSRFDPRAFTVVFAFLNCTQKGLNQLPFFSQLNLMRSADAISALGYSVEVIAIPA